MAKRRGTCCKVKWSFLCRSVYTVENAHNQLVRDLDFNPNKQYLLVSCGDDCKVRFWDTRNTNSSLMVLQDHSHWYVLFLNCVVIILAIKQAEEAAEILVNWSLVPVFLYSVINFLHIEPFFGHCTRPAILNLQGRM